MKTVLWVKLNPSRLAIVLRPSGGDGLQADLEEVRAAGVDVLVSLLTAEDAEELGLTEEGRIAQQLGVRFVSYPILDRCTPSDLGSFSWPGDRTSRSRSRRSRRRCALPRLHRPRHGSARVRHDRTRLAGGRGPAPYRAGAWLQVPDTPEQLDWILRFQPEP